MDLLTTLSYLVSSETSSFQGKQADNDDRGEQYRLYWHIEAEKKWTTFRRRHIQTHFLQWKYLNLD